MIILKDLISILTTGAFANTAFSGTDGILKDTHKIKVVHLINQGVVEIYKRFKLLENELTLHVTPNTRNYYLRPDRTASVDNITESKYIVEDYATDGFLNIVKVIAAFDSSGTEIRLNYPKVYDPNNVTIPIIISLANDILQITNLTAPQILSIIYQSYPNKLVVEDFDDLEGTELSIPDIAIEPLVAYIASKIFKPMGENVSTANADKSASYEQAYELACQKISLLGLSVQDTTERDTFVSNGWV